MNRKPRCRAARGWIARLTPSRRHWFAQLAAPVLFLVFALPGTPASGQAPAQNQPAQHRYWTTNWSFDSIDIEKLLGRLRRIGVEVPVVAQGDVTLNFAVSIPLDALTDGAAYRFNGTLSSNRLQLEQLLLADLATDIRYQSGELRLENLSTRWLNAQTLAAGRVDSESPPSSSAGRLSGNLTAQVVPRGDVSASLQANQLQLSPLFDLVNTLRDQAATGILSGLASGTLNASAPLNSLRLPAAWTVDADVQVANASVDDSVPLSLDSGPVSLREGKLVAEDIRIASPLDSSIRLLASANVNLQATQRFELSVRGNDVPVASLARLVSLGDAPMVRGKLDVNAQGSGELSPPGNASPQWDLSGRLASPALTVLGLQLGLIEHTFEFDSTRLSLSRIEAPALNGAEDRILIDRLDASYSIQDDSYRLSNLDAEIFDGTVQGSANFARANSGRHQVDLTWQSISPQLQTAFILPGSTTLAFRSSGEVQWSVAAARIDDLAAHQGTARIAIDPLQIGNVDIGSAKLALQSTGGQVGLEGNGELFGGTFRVDTTTQLADGASLSAFYESIIQSTTQGEFEANGVQLLDLTRTLTPENRRRIQGSVSAKGQVNLIDSGHGTTTGSATVIVDHASVDGQLLTQRLSAVLDYRQGRVQIRSLRGTYAGGRVEAVGDIQVPSGDGRLQVRLAAIDASTGLMPISENASSWAAGILSGQLTVETGRQIKARGAIEVRDSSLFSIAAGSAHASVAASADNNLARWSLDLNSIETSLDRGKIQGDASFRSSTIRPGAFDMSSQWQARRIDFTRLLEETAGSSSSYARGNLTGNLTLSGKGIRGAGDLNGRFDVELDGTQARAIPGLMFAQSYLGALSLTGTQFDQGRARGSIGAGIARIDEFWLRSDRVRVWADGRVQIPSGRMDVEAVISTGADGASGLASNAVARQLVVGASLPLAAIVEVNQLISNQTLYVDILGPISDPRLRVKPLQSLREGAAQFFLREAISTVAPIATGGGVISGESMR